MSDHHDRIAASLAEELGDDLEHARLYDASAWRAAEKAGFPHLYCADAGRKTRVLAESGFRVCGGCGDMIHAGTIACGLCGWEG